MYTFVRALAVAPGTNQRWAEVDISATPTSILLTKYRQVYVVLTDGITDTELTLNLDDVAAAIQTNAGTISDYLTAIGNKTLPTTVGSPVIVRNNAIFSDLWEAGFWADSIDYNVGAGVDLPQELRPHVVVKPDNPADQVGYDYLGFRQKVLANVNGFYHNTAADSKGFYIVDGNKSRLKSGSNQLGLLSFGTFGTFDIVPITQDMLAFDLNPDTGLVDKVHVKFADTDLTTKTPILILGGYMLLPGGNQCLLTNTNIFTFKTFKYPFLEKYFESEPYLDFDDFNIQHQTDNPNWVIAQNFKSQDFLTKYFTMSQSFMVLLDANTIVVEKTYPEKQTVPHTFMSWEEPKWPLVTGEGKHEVYWKQYEAGGWMLRCHDTFKRNYLFNTVGYADRVAVDNQMWMGKAGTLGDAMFLKLIEEEIQIQVS